MVKLKMGRACSPAAPEVTLDWRSMVLESNIAAKLPHVETVSRMAGIGCNMDVLSQR